MYRGKAKNVAEIGLGERQLIGCVVDKADHLQSEVKFAKQVTEALDRRAAAQADNAFPVYRGCHEKIPPQRPLDCVTGSRSVPDSAQSDARQCDVRQSTQRAVHKARKNSVRLAEIPGQQKRGDLPFSIFENVIAASPAVDDERQEWRCVALRRNRSTGRNIANALRQPDEQILVLLREKRAVLQLANEVMRELMHW